ncbi:neural cell adhesion molecule 1-like isoform X2 [Clytia hemisphaerica]|uniref:Uncharacterized protein n=1 Tax=Clytia hemisphaerica TaxID=252671 RepID=A0A7M5XEP2_9CNID
MHGKRLGLLLMLGLFFNSDCAEWQSRFKIFQVQHGQDAFMKCKVTGTFDGFYDSSGQLIKDNDKFKVINPTDGSDIYTLDVIAVEESDYGDLICRDTTSDDTATLEIDISIEPIKDANLAIGFEGVIKAEVFGMPRKQMEWKKGTKKVAIMDNSGKIILNEQNRYSIDPRGSLIIKEVVAEDKGDYTFTVVKDFSRDNKPVMVDTGIKPTIKTAPAASYTKTAGLELKLNCEWNLNDGTPNWTFTPFGGNTSTEVPANQVDNTGLTFAAVETSDEGDYVCSASNKYGETKVSTMIKSVITPPEITSDFLDTKQVVGDVYELSCEASGRPLPTVNIYQGGVSKTTGIGNTTFNVKVALAANGGYITDYKCVAGNGAKTDTGADRDAEKSMKLTMLTPPTIEKITDDVQSAIGLKFSIECVANGNPMPTVTLKQGGVDLVPADSKTDTTLINKRTVLYEVSSATKEDFQDIDCIASNDIGSTNKTVKLIEVVPPGNVTNVQASDLTTTTVLIRWEQPENIEGIDILYRISYCQLNNGTLVGACKSEDQKDNSLQLTDLEVGSTYQVKISAVNQKVVGHQTTFNFTTLEEKVTPPPPAPTNKKKGMSTGAIAGVIIAILLIILLVVDLFCCFFNQCGFTHCCTETFCANKSAKYQPTDTKDGENMDETAELKPKNISKEDVV